MNLPTRYCNKCRTKVPLNQFKNKLGDSCEQHKRRKSDIREDRRLRKRERKKNQRFEQQNIHKMGFSGKESLNRKEYHDSLISEHWIKFKVHYRQSNLPQACLICSDPKVDLHHWTYERIGSERLDDVVPLCRGHHKAAHKLVRTGIPLRLAHLKLLSTELSTHLF